METKINNVEITPNISKVLGKWFYPSDVQKDDSMLKWHIETCFDMQDYIVDLIGEEEIEFNNKGDF